MDLVFGINRAEGGVDDHDRPRAVLAVDDAGVTALWLLDAAGEHRVGLVLHNTDDANGARVRFGDGRVRLWGAIVRVSRTHEVARHHRR